MSDTTIYIVLGVAVLGGLLIVRRWRINQSAGFTLTDDGFEEFGDADELPASTSGKKPGVNRPKAVSSPSTAISTQRKSPARMTVAMPASLYGAYQVDMEISKLVHGQAHRMDVVGSRAPDDRRAIEASLLKSVNSNAADEDVQRRARGALEEYGFVARQSASLLSAPDPYERTSAARMLGDVKAPGALPFLLEALYDSESQVRNQAVLSIGELRLPSAIGALLDIARKHPDVPGSLLSKALNACSVESLDFFDGSVPEPLMLSGVNAHLLAEEIFRLEPAVAAEELPETVEDENLVKALTQIHSDVVTVRSEGIKLLGLFQVREAVSALVKVAQTDAESSLRARAISSLASINHETVFPAILIAMADESREVRAAAARSLSRLSFDRADAYIRVTRADDAESLRNVAEACVKAGIANQGIDRMTNGDHQAYEAMSVVALLVKARTFDPLLYAIENHPNMDVRLSLIHLLGMTGEVALAQPLRNAMNESQSDEINKALHEISISLDPSAGESQPQAEAALEFEHHSHAPVEVAADVTDEAASESELRDASQESMAGGEFAAETEVGLDSENEPERITDFAFEFTPASVENCAVEFEGEPNPTHLDSSGLPAPPIA
jgi:HEAT repeat protein